MAEIAIQELTNPLSPDQVKFLRVLMRWGGVAEPRELGLLADRAQDRARQKSKRAGLVLFSGGYWQITEAGRAALRSASA